MMSINICNVPLVASKVLLSFVWATDYPISFVATGENPPLPTFMSPVREAIDELSVD
jgi:hypothetical protein